MSKVELLAKIELLNKYEAMMDEIKAEADTIRNSIKAEMEAREVEELIAGQYIIRWTSVLSQRFDSTSFKKVLPELYKAYTKQVSSRRFTITAEQRGSNPPPIGGKDMYVLDKLWQGKLSPNEQCIVHGSQYSDLRHKASQLSHQFVSTLSEDGKRLFQEYQDLREQMSYISEEDMFVNGFRIGVGLLLDAVGSYESQFVRYHED